MVDSDALSRTSNMIPDLLTQQIASSLRAMSDFPLPEKTDGLQDPLIPSCGDYVSRGMKWLQSVLTSLIKFNPVTGAEMGCGEMAAVPPASMKSISSHNTIGILYDSLGVQKNLQVLDLNANAAADLPIRERQAPASPPLLSIIRSAKKKTNRTGPDPPPRPSNLLKIHELREVINFHSYSNIAGHRMVTFATAADPALLRSSSGNSRLLHRPALMLVSCFADQSLFRGTSEIFFPRQNPALGYDVPRRSMPPVAVASEPVYETLCHVKRENGPQTTDTGFGTTTAKCSLFEASSVRESLLPSQRE